jgi:hypothetical protein
MAEHRAPREAHRGRHEQQKARHPAGHLDDNAVTLEFATRAASNADIRQLPFVQARHIAILAQAQETGGELKVGVHGNLLFSMT